ncbi:hypothetical protein L596_003596 [Steinernema carpocapsae]|uniref:Uncharacterized protein n=1 Tax=Steinernema carpocapsae TaxID=34508 RepID=A0A4U8UT72_STECR|nr:hypothetical protein L596_003596 [Steinernema carpocapsae]
MLFIVLLLSGLCTDALDEEFQLFRDLRHNYDPFVRPVANYSEALKVTVKLYLQQILDVDEKNQVITLLTWIEYTWDDYKLVWNPQEYGEITDIRIPGTAQMIWRPDVLLYNSADENFDSTFPVNIIVHYDGRVVQVPPGILKLSCKIDITWFPFDNQICHLKFGSWTYSGEFLDLSIQYPDGTDASSPSVVDTSYYVENGEWNLLATPARTETIQFNKQTFQSIYFYLIIQRRTLYYALNLIVPSLLISLMTVLGFTLPPEAGEKITLEITILLSVCFFLSMVAEMTPPTSEAIPLIGAYFSCCLLVVSASVVFTVLVLNLHNRKPYTHEMSPFLKSCLLYWLPWILLMRRPGVQCFNRKVMTSYLKAQRKQTSCLNLSNARTTARALSVEYLMQKHVYSSVTQTCPKSYSVGGSLGKNLESNFGDVCEQLKQVNNYLWSFLRKIKLDQKEEKAEDDWRFAAMVVDRLCLFVFTAFIVISTCAIMMSSPHLLA